MTKENDDGRIDVAEDGALRVVQLNNPSARNAISPAMHSELIEVLRYIAADEQAKVVMITGVGSAFSAGGDIEGMLRSVSDEEFRLKTIAEAREIVRTMADFPLPIIAAVNGPAVGFGCTLALLCDIVLIAVDAYLSDPHVSVGLVAGDGGTVIWPLLTSLSRAKQFLFTGDRAQSSDAVTWGLAAASYPKEQLLDEALLLANRIAAQPSYALRATKRALNLHLEHTLSFALEAAIASELVSLGSSEFKSSVESMAQRFLQRSENTRAASLGHEDSKQVGLDQ